MQGTLLSRLVERALTHPSMPVEEYHNHAALKDYNEDKDDADAEVAARVMSLKALIELYSPVTPEAEALHALQRLEALGPLSPHILQSTNIEKAVAALMKNETR